MSVQAKANGAGIVGVATRMAYHHLCREGTEMDAIIGKYRARMEGTGLVLTHATGISFDLTLDEALGLMELIKGYQDARAAAQHDTEPRIEKVVVDEESSGNTDQTGE